MLEGDLERVGRLEGHHRGAARRRERRAGFLAARAQPRRPLGRRLLRLASSARRGELAAASAVSGSARPPRPSFGDGLGHGLLGLGFSRFGLGSGGRRGPRGAARVRERRQAGWPHAGGGAARVGPRSTGHLLAQCPRLAVDAVVVVGLVGQVIKPSGPRARGARVRAGIRSGANGDRQRSCDATCLLTTLPLALSAASGSRIDPSSNSRPCASLVIRDETGHWKLSQTSHGTQSSHNVIGSYDGRRLPYNHPEYRTWQPPRPRMPPRSGR